MRCSASGLASRPIDPYFIERMETKISGILWRERPWKDDTTRSLLWIPVWNSPHDSLSIELQDLATLSFIDLILGGRYPLFRKADGSHLMRRNPRWGILIGRQENHWVVIIRDPGVHFRQSPEKEKSKQIK